MNRKVVSKREKAGQLRIGVIEEVADNIYSIKFVLQSIGFDVRSFACESSVIPVLKDLAPDLIIIDMMIPEGGGYDMIRLLSRSVLKRTPILAITAEAMEGDEEQVLKAGAADLLAKPYTVDKLQKKLGKWLP